MSRSRRTRFPRAAAALATLGAFVPLELACASRPARVDDEAPVRPAMQQVALVNGAPARGGPRGLLELARRDVEQELALELDRLHRTFDLLERRLAGGKTVDPSRARAVARARRRLELAEKRLADLRAASEDDWPRARHRLDDALHDFRQAWRRATRD